MQKVERDKLFPRTLADFDFIKIHKQKDVQIYFSSQPVIACDVSYLSAAFLEMFQMLQKLGINSQ